MRLPQEAQESGGQGIEVGVLGGIEGVLGLLAAHIGHLFPAKDGQALAARAWPTGRGEVERAQRAN